MRKPAGVDNFTRQGMARVDRGLAAAGSMRSVGTTIGVGGAIAVVALVAAAIAVNNNEEDPAVYIFAAVVLAFQTVVVVTVFHAIGAAVELLAGQYELALVEGEEDE